MDDSADCPWTRCINEVVKKIHDSALPRRPLQRYRPATLSTRRGFYFHAPDEDDQDYEDDSPDYCPPERAQAAAPVVEKKRKRVPLAVCNRDGSPTRSPISKKQKLDSPKQAPSSSSPYQQDALLPPTINEALWGERIPVDALQHIFRCAMITERTVPFLTQMQQVCRLWRQAASSASLWADVDLEFLKNADSAGVFNGLQKYAAGIRSLSVSRWVKLTVNQIEEFLRSTKELRSLNVSFCCGLDLRRLLCIVIPECCPKLNSLDFSFIDPTGHKRLSALLREFLSTEHGRRLESLVVTGNALANLRRLCAESALNKATENVRILHLSRVCMLSQTSHKIRLVDFVNAFPNLRVLNLEDAMLDFTCTAVEENTFLPGCWPHLSECSIAATSEWHRYTEVYDVFIRVLGRCKNLRRLDLSGFSVHDRLIWLRETPLTHLNLSRVRDMARNAVTIDFFSTWGRSLETLSIAWVVGCVGSLCALFAEAKKRGLTPRLKRLDLTGTCVTAAQLSVLLDLCQSLEFVDVQSCRGMPLGMKQAFDGVEELAALRKDLEIATREFKPVR